MRVHSLIPLLLALGCGGKAATSAQVFAGPVSGSDVAVGVVVDGTSMALYACGGATTYATDSRWFLGAASSSGAFTLTKDGWTASGTVTASSVSGTLTSPANATLSFNVPVYANSAAGLYEGVGTGGCMTGVVAWPSNGTMQTQGTWCNGTGDFEQVIPVTPVATGFSITVDHDAEVLYFNVVPAAVLVGG